MSTQPAEASLPRWTLGDRMRKAREHAGLYQTDIAERTGIARSTIIKYEQGRSEPSRPNLLAWAMATGIPQEWICHGDLRPCDYRPRGIPADGTQRRSNYMQSSYAEPIAIRAA